MVTAPQPSLAATSHDPVEDAMARYAAHTLVEMAIEAWDLPGYEEALRALASRATTDTERQALQRLGLTRRLFARPVHTGRLLPLWTLAGCGNRLIGERDRLAGTQVATCWISLFFLPLWPLRSYIVHEVAGYQYEFLSEVPTDTRGRWLVIGVPLLVAIVYAVLKLKGAI